MACGRGVRRYSTSTDGTVLYAKIGRKLVVANQFHANAPQKVFLKYSARVCFYARRGLLIGLDADDGHIRHRPVKWNLTG